MLFHEKSGNLDANGLKRLSKIRGEWFKSKNLPFGVVASGHTLVSLEPGEYHLTSSACENRKSNQVSNQIFIKTKVSLSRVPFRGKKGNVEPILRLRNPQL
jgi:hypothetical protein